MCNDIKSFGSFKELRLILGDQLNSNHTWFQTLNVDVLYVMAEVRSETNYVKHHIQKVLGIFAAMRQFGAKIAKKGHQIFYKTIDDELTDDSLLGVLLELKKQTGATQLRYQQPDEYRLDVAFNELHNHFEVKIDDTEHFFATRYALKTIFAGKKTYLMERFYRQMRKEHHVLMQGGEPIGGAWNFDAANRNPYDGKAPIPQFPVFLNDVSNLYTLLKSQNIETIGEAPKSLMCFDWPINETQAIQLLDFFVANVLPYFGKYQDAMFTNEPFLFHSRLSFALNLKLISPKTVVEAAQNAYFQNPDVYSLSTVEGFIRQILGWREYMRGVYWAQMPIYATTNYFNHHATLPQWFWNGKTKMKCVQQVVQQSLSNAYAHHIQRLMITGNFALLAAINPDEVDAWYLGIYIDAFEWVQITNTRGMSQYADGGLLASKPYVSSANYIQKMSNYCKSCHYNPKLRVGTNACPFNSLYWDFFERNKSLLANNPRIGMVYNNLRKMDLDEINQIQKQAAFYKQNIEHL